MEEREIQMGESKSENDPEQSLEINEELSVVRRNDSTYVNRLKEVIFAFLPLGFITFGGPQAHVALLQHNFVQQRQWVSHEQFTELFALGQALPGPTSTQMAIALGTMHAGYLGGILAFFFFGAPGFLFLTMTSCVMYYGLMDEGGAVAFPTWLLWVQHGLSCCAISLVASAAWKLSQKIDSMLTQLLLVFGAGVTILYKAPWTLPVTLLIGGLYGTIHIRFGMWINKRMNLKPGRDLTWKERFWILIDLLKSVKTQRNQAPLPTLEGESPSDDSNHVPMNQQADSEEEKPAQDTMMHTSIPLRATSGFIILGLFVGILITVIILRQFVSWKPIVLFEGFFRTGSYIIGGGQVVLPMIMVEFTEKNQYMTKDQFMNGFAITSALPGPMFNLSAYLGGIISGLPGALISFVALFLPGFLFIWGVLPFWSRYREKVIIKHFLVGVNSVAVGLVYAAVYLLWGSVTESLDSHWSLTLSAVTVLTSFALLHFANITTPLVVVFSGALRYVLFAISQN